MTMDVGAVVVAAPLAPLAFATNGNGLHHHSEHAVTKRKAVDQSDETRDLAGGCRHLALADDAGLAKQLHDALRRARHDAQRSAQWLASEEAGEWRRARVLCVSCEFSGPRESGEESEDAATDAPCFMTHAILTNHHLALLPRKKQLFCARCLDFVYPDALLALTQHAMPSHHLKSPPTASAPHQHGRHHHHHHHHHHHRPVQPHRPPALRRRLLRSAARRGLVNMGNTCFMNAVLQALAHNPLLQHEYFVVRGHNTTICEQRRRQQQQQQRDAAAAAAPPTLEPCMACELSALMQTLFPSPRATLTARHLTSPVVPQSFLETFWATSPAFVGANQQDAHEFLVSLLNGVHSHTCPRAPLAATSSNGGGSLLSPRFSPTGQPLCDCVVHQNFAGAFSSELQCVFCDTVTSKYEPFLDISLSLDAPPLQAPRKHSKSDSHEDESAAAPLPPPPPPALSLDALFDRFTQEERLKGAHQIYCRRCSRYVDAMKRLVLHKLPNLLVLHLGRFDFIKKRKITDAVAFPIKGLDLRDFCTDADAASTPNGSAVASRRDRKGSLAAEAASGRGSPLTVPPMRDAMYDLAAVISHHGDSVDGGHFTAFVHASQDASSSSAEDPAAAADASWLHFDDSTVTRVTAQRVEQAQAYMLFYVRRRLFV